VTLSIADQKKAQERRQAKRIKTQQWQFKNPNAHKERDAKNNGVKTVKLQTLLNRGW
jgi:hypothetical protein